MELQQCPWKIGRGSVDGAPSSQSVPRSSSSMNTSTRAPDRLRRHRSSTQSGSRVLSDKTATWSDRTQSMTAMRFAPCPIARDNGLRLSLCIGHARMLSLDKRRPLVYLVRTPQEPQYLSPLACNIDRDRSERRRVRKNTFERRLHRSLDRLCRSGRNDKAPRPSRARARGELFDCVCVEMLRFEMLAKSPCAFGRPVIPRRRCIHEALRRRDLGSRKRQNCAQ